MRYAVILAALLLPACGHQFVGQTYRVEGGRQVGELFGHGTTAWKVAAEYRFEQRGSK